jgi:hypothetical protein
MLPSLEAWENFYIIVGSSAGALTGLQFVVMTLIAGQDRRDTDLGTISAFGTPTVVHFCFVLLLGAVISAPWRDLGSVAIVLGLTALAGILYVAIVTRRAKRQTGYEPVLEDWIWHSVVPMAGYVSVAVASILLVPHPTTALFMIAAASLALLFDGIHNAWDTVTFVATRQQSIRQDRPE